MILFSLSSGEQGIVSDEDADLVAHTPWYPEKDGRGLAHQTYPNGIHGKRKMELLHRLIAERKLGRILTREDIVTCRNGNHYNCMRENLIIRPRRKEQSREVQQQKELEQQGYLPCAHVAKKLGMTRTALANQRELGRVSSIYLRRIHYMHPEVTRQELEHYCTTRRKMSGRKPCKALFPLWQKAE